MRDGKNPQNVKERINRAFRKAGNINWIVTSLSERPYEKGTFNAIRLKRETILLGGLLTKAKSWLTLKNIDDLKNIYMTKKYILLYW